MKRYYSLWKSTWWLWMLIIGGAFYLSTLSNVLMCVSLVYLPICVVIFLWFGLVRYDDQGNPLDIV
ncbi:hypothetical protein [Blastopirellula retiformator]|uniref:Uncharacterized protein n=1 Tax=Blastopirellula retiformator TaxID=2527970 RepID=A0A5C5VLE4_9BACT|nr:hypothetical protein [Blastopirellula retiformator]TWT39446.1 hypothetical protein Enr8_11450 [Blastopirellula retiformator]